MRSISTRLLLGSAIILTIFVLLTGLSVSYSVKQRAETALFDRLQGLVYGILGATEIENQQRPVVNDLALPDERLNQPSSGLYAEVIGNGGTQLWESNSTTKPLPPVTYSPIGEWIFGRIDQADNEDVHRMQMTTVWELDSGEEIPFIVHAVADANLLSSQLKRFDTALWLSLLGSAIGLLLLQLFILHRSLSPLRTIGDELDEIEKGTREHLDENVATELKPLASSINLLLKSEKNRHKQYRHLLNDLAHSLKTPLSVLKNLGNNSQDTNDTREVLHEQTNQMQSTVDHYLQRAATRTPQYLSKPISPLQCVEKLCQSLTKIYHEPSPSFSMNIDEQFHVRLAEVDLMEVLGNALDNACKFGARNISISTDLKAQQIIIDDDGPGFPEESRSSLTNRGVRADNKVEGQGMGLAATEQLMQSYGGSIKLDSSPSGGARVILQFLRSSD